MSGLAEKLFDTPIGYHKLCGFDETLGCRKGLCLDEILDPESGFLVSKHRYFFLQKMDTGRGLRTSFKRRAKLQSILAMPSALEI